MLLYGPPGLGKTTLAYIIAAEMGVSIRITSGPAIERIGDLAAILTSLQEGDVLFIDEIHRLSRVVEEILYPAMEDGAIDLVIGKGPGARSIRLAIKPFTLVGATTRYAMMSPPLRDRFGAVYRLDFYDAAALVADHPALGRRSSASRSTTTARRRSRSAPAARRASPTACCAASATTPRSRADGHITGGRRAGGAGAASRSTDLGLDGVDERVLRTIIEKFDGGPVGLETIAASISEEADTIMDVYEPYLMQLGFLAAHAPRPRRPRGSPTSTSASSPARARRPRRRRCSIDALPAGCGVVHL